MSLSEFLQQKTVTHGAEAARNKDTINEWLEAVIRLFDQLRAWLAAADPTGILEVTQGKTEVKEPSLGRYQAPRLDIRAFGAWIGIIPKARKTIRTAQPPQFDAPERATGRVDITDEVRRYVLYRFPDGGGGTWYIEGPSAKEPEPLTQQLFEEAMMSYLR